MTVTTTERVPVNERTRRTDAGRPRLMPRDAEAITWLEDMRAISEPDLGVLLGRLSGRAPLSLSATQNVVDRWKRAGLAQAQKVYAHQPRFVWLTSQGARLAGADRWTEPGWGVLAHTAMVARTRLWLESHPEPGWRPVAWLSERQWRRQRAKAVAAGVHVPDAELTMPDGIVCALEVELSDKGPARTVPIVANLAAAYQHVLYVVPKDSQTARTVRGALDEALEQMRRASMPANGRVTIINLPEEVS